MNFIKIEVELNGIKPLLFNQYVSKDETNIPVEKKILIRDGKVCITSDRLMAFLLDNNPKTRAGCIKSFLNSKEYKKVLPLVDAYVSIFPFVIPVCDSEKYAVKEDKVCGGGVPNLVQRPMLEKWGCKFNINLVENQVITFEKLKDWFEKGGIEVGLGAFRPRYGQFFVKKFDIVS